MTRDLEGWLDEVVIGERQPGPIRLVAYDPEWPAQYDRIHDRLQGALGTRARMIEHIGSTAVPGLLAKPIIDVLVTVDDVEDEGAYASAITRLGYDLRVREPGHRMFRPASLDAHVHVWNEGSREQRDYLLLRDWLRDSADDRADVRAAQTPARRRGLARRQLLRPGQGRVDRRAPRTSRAGAVSERAAPARGQAAGRSRADRVAACARPAARVTSTAAPSARPTLVFTSSAPATAPAAIAANAAAR